MKTQHKISTLILTIKAIIKIDICTNSLHLDLFNFVWQK